jgi:YHS domain-containing protein
MQCFWAGVAAVGILASSAVSIAQEPDSSDSPPKTFEAFAHMVGAWKGQASPSKDKLRGWVEHHEWAWTFKDGRPVGLALKSEDGKVVREARLSHDDATGKYRLEGTSAEGDPLRYEGTFDKTKGLVLDRPIGTDGVIERLTIRPNSNKIRYVLWIDRKEKGAPAFARSIEMNLGREGVNFAAGGGASTEAECVVTGGTATMTVTHDGQTYALCCSGCREQFLANPTRYIEKAKLRAQNKAKKPVVRSTGDDDF